VSGPTPEEVRARLGPRLIAPDAAFNAPGFKFAFGREEKLFHVVEHGAAFRPAAVLVPLITHEGEIRVLLTERNADLPDHGGQISFPGGRVEDGDSGAVDTALREAEEEVGLMAGGVSVLGALEPHGTISNYRVTPIVALAPPFESVPQAEEVANIFEVPFSFVLDPANHRFLERGRDGRSRATYAIPYGEWFIFGFTARILIKLALLWHAEDVTAPPSRT
jgi:8-oxo-dGTP pyrophosphatase MutT (NUDIX family)